mgnify:CR=1 FL=1
MQQNSHKALPVRIAGVVIPLLFSIVLTFALLEIGFRLFPQTIPAGACRQSEMLSDSYCRWFHDFSDPALGYVFKPFYHYEGIWDSANPQVAYAEEITCPRDYTAAFWHELSADGHGFVNPWPWQEHYDIVLTGDSFTQQYASTYWLDLVRQRTGMSVLNLGIGGWGTLSEIAAVQEFGLDRSPDWVILMYYDGNDLFNSGQYADRAASGEDWLSYEMAQFPWYEKLVVPHVLRFWAGQISGAGRPHIPASEEECRYPITVNTNYGSFETLFSDINISHLSRTRDQIERSREWKLISQGLLDLDAAVEAQGGRFLIIYVPSREHVYWGQIWDQRDLENFLMATAPQRSFDEYGETVAAQVGLFQDFTARHHIEFLDLTGPYWLAAREQGAMYNYADDHWNDAGNELAAQLIGDYLLQGP